MSGGEQRERDYAVIGANANSTGDHKSPLRDEFHSHWFYGIYIEVA